ASGIGDPRRLPSFPTRRSSDLESIRRETILTQDQEIPGLDQGLGGTVADAVSGAAGKQAGTEIAGRVFQRYVIDPSGGIVRIGRSEEHTSELQSRENLVCRLLL